MGKTRSGVRRCEAFCTSCRNVGRRCKNSGTFDNYHQAVLCDWHLKAEDLAFSEEAARRILRERNRIWMRESRARMVAV